MHFHGWKRGLKTGMYYLRTQPATEAIKFTLGKSAAAANGEDDAAEGGKDRPMTAEECSILNPDACEMCSG